MNFDYLPEFREDLKLEFVSKQENIKSLTANNFHIEIEELSTSIDSFSKNGITRIFEVGTQAHFGGGNKEIWKQELSKGKYLMRISGVYTNSNGTTTSDNIHFNIKSPNAEPIKLAYTAYNMAGYSYPFTLSHLLDASEGECTMELVTLAPNTSITNAVVVLSPVVCLA